MFTGFHRFTCYCVLLVQAGVHQSSPVFTAFPADVLCLFSAGAHRSSPVFSSRPRIPRPPVAGLLLGQLVNKINLGKMGPAPGRFELSKGMLK